MTKVFFLFILLTSLTGFTQNITFKSNAEYRDAMYTKSKTDIELLKSGVLLVRIHGQSKAINYYKKYNNFKAAKKIDEKTRAFNMELIKAFRQGYKICPIYFFEDTFSLDILNGNFDRVVFYTDSLIADPTIKVSTSNFFIAEYGFTEGDTSGFRSDYIIESGEEEGTNKEKVLYKEENLNVSAFVIRDKRFVMLQDPFPYFSKVVGKYPSFAKMRKKIFVWNSALGNY